MVILMADENSFDPDFTVLYIGGKCKENVNGGIIFFV